MQHNQCNRNRTIDEYFFESLLALFPQLKECLETIHQAIQVLAPYAVNFFQWLQEQPAKNRESFIKLSEKGWFPDLGMSGLRQLHASEKSRLLHPHIQPETEELFQGYLSQITHLERNCPIFV